MSDTLQQQFLFVLDKVFFVTQPNENSRKYFTTAILNGLYQPTGNGNTAKPEYKDFHLPDIFFNTKENGFSFQRTEVQDLTIGFAVILWYAKKKNLSLSLCDDNAGSYTLFEGK